MIGLMASSILLLLIWSAVELVGVFSDASEDTYSEWVFDLPLWGVLIIVGLHLIWGFLLIGSAWHFLEGWGRRRKIEKGDDITG